MNTVKHLLAGFSSLRGHMCGMLTAGYSSTAWLFRLCLVLLAVIFSLQTTHARPEPPILKLSFAGYQGEFNGRIINVPPYDFDGNPNYLSSAEMSNIHQIYERVVEDFSPFHIDVEYHPWLDSTPSNYDALIIIGGTRRDSRIRSYGEADLDKNIGIVPVTFPCAGRNLRDYCDPLLEELPEKLRMMCNSALPPSKGCPEFDLEAWDIAHGVSHEAGHIIVGWNPKNRWLAHYQEAPWETDPVNEWDRTALMGTHVNLRDTWWHHAWMNRGYIPGTEPPVVVEGPQDDIAELMAVLGLTDDSGGHTLASAPVIPLGPTYRTMWVNGRISMNQDSWPTNMGAFNCGYYVIGVGYILCPLYMMGHDTDFWRFYVRRGETVEVRVYTRNTLSDRTRANLIPGLELWRKSGGSWSLVPGASVNANTDVWWIGVEEYLPAGEYAVSVKSAGGYGDLGQYTLRVYGDHIAKTP